MPLKYPDEWKFGDFDHEIPIGAHQAFTGLIRKIVEGRDDAKAIYEEFKTAFGDNSSSSSASWAEDDLWRVMRAMMEHAARYIAAFHAGMEALRKQRISVPPVEAINKILRDHAVPLAIEGNHLVLTGGDIEFDDAATPEKPESRRFSLGEQIGKGSFGKVFKVTRTTQIGEYHFAMKLLEPHVFIENKERAKTRFVREMRILEKLQHRGIVQLLEAGLDKDQTPYILMPLIEGEELDKALSGAESEDVFTAFDEVLRALEFAHNKKVIHRDLKPSNILMRAADKQPIILDFGCAFYFDEIDASLTTQLIGTPGYVPEEVLQNPKHRDVRQDVYACGVMLYQAIMGKLPRQSRYQTVEGTFDGYVGIDNVIRAAIASEEDRTASANLMRQQLAKVTAHNLNK